MPARCKSRESASPGRARRRHLARRKTINRQPESPAPERVWNRVGLAAPKRSGGGSAASLPVHLRSNFQPQRVEADEAGRVVLIVRFGRVGLHRGNAGVVKADGGFPAGGNNIPLVEL